MPIGILDVYSRFTFLHLDSVWASPPHGAMFWHDARIDDKGTSVDKETDDMKADEHETDDKTTNNTRISGHNYMYGGKWAVKLLRVCAHGRSQRLQVNEHTYKHVYKMFVLRSLLLGTIVLESKPMVPVIAAIADASCGSGAACKGVLSNTFVPNTIVLAWCKGTPFIPCNTDFTL
eukprot:SAG22_NODE_104_length_20159_cov_5.877517_24_plen_176_part_00